MIKSAVAGLILLTMIGGIAPPGHTQELGYIPGFTARNLQGKKVNLTDVFARGPTVITFWATWCKPCRKELPELQKLVDKYGEKGFQVIGINGDGPVDQAKVRPYVKALGFDFTIILDPDGEIRRRLQVEVFPTSFLVDREGRITHRQVGYRRGDETILEAKVQKLIGSADKDPGEPPGR